MRRIDKPWGHEVIWAETDNYVGKLLHINAGHRLSKQYHMIKEETVYVISGILYNYEDSGSITKILPGNSLHINVGQIHRFGANESSVELIEVSTPYLDDVIRIEDDYKREKSSDGVRSYRQGHPVVTREVAGSSPAAPAKNSKDSGE